MIKMFSQFLARRDNLRVYHEGELAAQTLDSFGIRHHFVSKVPHISRRQGNDICRFERLSLGQASEEFYSMIGKILRE